MPSPRSRPQPAPRNEPVTDVCALPLAALAPRERVLKTAAELFNRHGVHSVGVDRIIGESGVAKMTFYKHFPAKARLVAEYLRHRNALWQRQLEGLAAQARRSPLERLLGVFDLLAQTFASPDFRGCPFIKGMAEFGPDAESPEVLAAIQEHYEQTLQWLETSMAQIGTPQPRRKAQALFALIEGTIVIAQAGLVPDIARLNKDAARVLLTQA